MSIEYPGLESQRLLPSGMEDGLFDWAARTVGIVLLAVVAVAWVSLLSWSLDDPSLTHATSGPTANVLGPLGANISDLLLQTLGLAAIFALLVPAGWGAELLVGERIPQFRLKLVLFPVAVIALAGGCSALPTAATWPLHHGFGGVLGDIVYSLVAGVLGLINPHRAGVAAGMLVFAAGGAAITFSLGLSRKDLPPFLRRHPGVGLPSGRMEPTIGPSLGDEARPVSRADVRIEPSFRERIAKVRSRDHELLRDDHFEPVEQDAGVALDEDDAPAPRGADFDETTEDDSCAIAKRFAPPSAKVAGGSTKPAARTKGGGLLGGFVRSRDIPSYRRPSLNLLKKPTAARPGPELTQTVLRGNARLLEDVLADFGVKGEIKDIRPGPVITLFELEPARGTKSSRVIGLADDIARSMSASAVRVAVVPGRNAIGIELPNSRRETVLLRELLETDAFAHSAATLPMALGKGIGGEPIVADLARMPHMLVAGTTGSGKSVGVNAMILSLLYRLSPDQCRLLLIDPKMLELSVYNGIPHLLTPVVTDPHKAVAALNWAVREMEERYKRMAQLGVRNIELFNTRVRNADKRGEPLHRTVQTGFDRETGQAIYEKERLELQPMPYIVVVVDEFADLMSVAGKDIEQAVQRLAQMARAAGIHLIMATQRPSVDIITGTIKANFPTRISFKVTSKVDSRTILNEQGAEQLLGQGDMLYSSGAGGVVRVHGPFVSDEEVEAIAVSLREQGEPRYVEGITDDVEPALADEPVGDGSDDLYDKAVAIVLRDRKASTSYLQRRLSVGYNRAADLIERMEADGIITPANAVGKRDILAGGRPASDAA
jgi:S-DNA-T family DNA segregation ATPase FtsK/SpoIIIE